LISGCSSKAYDTELESGKAALKEEKYEDALASFNKAAKEKSTDEIQQYIKFTTYMIDSQDFLNKGEFSSAILTSKKVSSSKEKSEIIEILKPKALKLQSDATELEGTLKSASEELAKGKNLLEENNFDEAYTTFQTISQIKEQHPKLEEITKESLALMKQALERKNAFLTEQKEKEEAAKKAEAERIAQEKQKAEQTPQKISKEQAEQNVRQYLNLQPNPNLFVEYDHDNENGDYVIHVYDIVIDNPETKEGHTATRGWYGVDPDNGFVYDAFNY
jgi:hypothetical protein